MSKWPDAIEACISCTGSPDAYAHGGRGYCVRCYSLHRRMEKIRRWKWEDPSSLDGFPKSNMSIVNTKERFEIVRAAFLRQLGRRLTVLQHREEIRRHEVPVDGLSLEAQFGRVLKLIRPGARQPMNASYLSENFNEQERRIIHALLEQMIERKPWRGIQWSPIWRKVLESKDGSVGQ